MKSLLATFALLGSLVSSAVASPRTSPAGLFEDDCQACHTIGGGPAVGPDLKGVTTRQTREWLTRFILDPQKVVDSGDPYARQLVAAADGFVMPPLDDPLPQGFIHQLFDYIEAQGNGPGGTVSEPAPSLRPFTEADVLRGRAHFTGEMRLSGGGPACVACHHIGDLAAFGGGGLGPDLTSAFTRLKGRRGMAAWLSSPPTPTMRAVYGAHKFTAEENDSLVALFERSSTSAGARAARLPFMASGMGGAAVCMAAMMWIWRGRFRSVQSRDSRRAAGDTR